MSGNTTLPSETTRLSFLRSLNILDTPREPELDRLVYTAAQLFHTPIALITLVDEQRQWFKAQVGLSVSETRRADAFCSHTIQTNEIMIVEDAMHDQRFADNPFVTGAPFIRFYAGAPLLGPKGMNIGSFCVIDRRPRHLTSDDRLLLRLLADSTMHYMIPLQTID